MNIKGLFDYVKDHVTHFGCFPMDYEDMKTGDIFEFPKYMAFFTNRQREELTEIFDSHSDYKQ